MRYVSDKSCRENQNTFCVQYRPPPPPPKIMPFMRLKKYDTARQDADDNVVWRMCCPCSVTKTTDTHSEYVILTAFSPQQWLRERVSLLRYTYSAYLLIYEETTVAGHVVRSDGFPMPVTGMGGCLGRRRPVGKHSGGWEDAVRRDIVDLLQIQMSRATVRSIGGWRWLGEALARKRDE
jgi:hypothetical protein